MNSTRWRKKQPTAAEKRIIEREKALQQCKNGIHSFTATFRPSESVCLICGLVKFCPDCLRENKLPEATCHAITRICTTHEVVEVRV